MRWFISARRFLLSVLLYGIAAAISCGGSFDTGLSPEKTRDLLVGSGLPAAPAGSWLRFQDFAHSTIRDETGKESMPWPGAKTEVPVAERRAALSALRTHGYRLVALVRWPADSWAGGVRPDQPRRRLALDLREAYHRSQQLAATYGDLVDFWEIDNEPDISFVEENPETYAAFLKACYLGIKSRAPIESHVMMAPFALPPGPYFVSWLANDALRYTDAFNYHYYGYAEDFTGVFRQFEQAVGTAPVPAAAGETVLQTQFYPSGAGWQTRSLAPFTANQAPAPANRALLQSRPLAAEEPSLQSQGRWLVSAGLTVKETAEGWEFTVASPADGPLRPAMAELPLPEGWSAPAHANLAFEYRIAGATVVKAKENEGGGSQPLPSKLNRPAAAISYPAPLPAVSRLPADRSRELPVFLTEYGYGLLDKDARQTRAGREAQRVWFATVQRQIHSLPIEGAMAFILRPYLEAERSEFGLLMETPLGGGEGGKDQLSLGQFTQSPALEELLAAKAADGLGGLRATATPPPTPVVLDIVGGAGLQMSKSHRGYVLQGDNAAAQLVVYHFGPASVSGELVLDGGAWTLPGGGHTIRLTLVPGERREIPVTIHPEVTARFGGQAATVRFVIGGPPVVPPPLPPTPSLPVTAGPPPPVVVPPAIAPLPPGQELEIYFRTQNGNLYQTWPRLQAREAWQWYAEPLANFTPAFFGRAYLPAALAENKPVALVFFFRPDKYPATYLVRHAQVVEYVREKKTEN